MGQPCESSGRETKKEKKKKRNGGSTSLLGMEMEGEKKKNGEDEIGGSDHVGVSKEREEKKWSKKMGARVRFFR